MKIIISFIIGLFIYTSLFGQTANENLKITHLIGDFYVFTTYKQYKGKPMSANGMYVLTEEGVILFDTPWDTTQFQPLLDSIKNKHLKEVVICMATHSHEDRTGGLEYYKQLGIKTYTTRQTDEISKKWNDNRAEFLIEKDTIFNIGSHTFQTYYGGQGHTPDNIVIWFKKEKILYGGCLVKSIEANDLGYLGDANIKEWRRTIENIQKLFKKPNHIVTGHQDWESKKSLNHTLKLLKEYKEKNR